MCKMGSVKTFCCLVVLMSAVFVKGEEDPVIEEDLPEEGGEGESGQQLEFDWSQMLQMGMALGKGILGEEAVEDLKKGDLSSLMQAGEKLFGEENVKNIFNAVTEGVFSTNFETKDGKQEFTEQENGLEDDEELIDSEEPINETSTEEEMSSLPQAEAVEEKLADEL